MSTNELALDVTLLRGKVLVHDIEGKSKPIAYEDFLSILSANIEKKDIVEGVRLPKNAFMTSTNGRNMSVFMYFPEAVKTIKHRCRNSRRSEIEEYTFLVPNMLISVQLTREDNTAGVRHRVTDVRYAVTSTTLNALMIPLSVKGIGVEDSERVFRISPSNNLHITPFSNFYGDGRFCTGENQVPHECLKGDLRNLGWYYDVVWESVFNDDLGINGASGDFGNLPHHWYKACQKFYDKFKTFNYAMLRNTTERGLTYSYSNYEEVIDQAESPTSEFAGQVSDTTTEIMAEQPTF